MLRPALVSLVALTFVSFACGGETPGNGGSGGTSGSSTLAGSGGSVAGSAAGSLATGGGGATPGGAGGSGGTVATAGAGGTAAGGAAAGGTGGAAAGGGGSGGSGGTPGSGGSVNNVPGDYKGTPYTALKIPGRINACDYDRGGPGIGWCHDMGNCGAGTVTGDYPQASGVYRTPMPAGAKICGGAQCDDNAGVCRMNPSKPDNTINGQPMPAADTYLCYTTAGMWSKYTVQVEQAGTYAVGGIMAVPQNGAFNLSFGGNITTGNVSLAITPTTNSGSGENYHSWDTRMNLATVTFPAAGTYLMTFTQVGRFNADAFTFTKM
jgi:hypothetical protein